MLGEEAVFCARLSLALKGLAAAVGFCVGVVWLAAAAGLYGLGDVDASVWRCLLLVL